MLLSLTLLVKEVPRQEKCDGFGTSAIIRGHVTAQNFLISTSKMCCDRTNVGESRGNHCKSGESADRGIEYWFPGMIRGAIQTFTKLVFT